MKNKLELMLRGNKLPEIESHAVIILGDPRSAEIS